MNKNLINFGKGRYHSNQFCGVKWRQVGMKRLYLHYLCWHSTTVGKIATPILALTPPSIPLKSKGFPYSLPSIGPRADPGVQAVSPQVTISHPPGGRLPLFSARLAVTFSATEHHRPWAGTTLYCLMTEAHSVDNLPKVVTQFLP